MRILIHCDGGPAIGAGHVFRAAALAEVALARGHQIDFSGTFAGSLVTDRLGSLAVDVVSDPRLAAYDVVHLDTYGPEGDDLAGRAAGLALLSNLEDGTFGRRPADLVVDPTLGAEATRRDVGPVLLRGSRWAVVRRSVTERAGQAVIGDPARRVLVVLGGTDVHAVTGQVLDVLADTGRDLAVTAITQPASREELERTIAQLDLAVELVPPRPDLTELMLDQDLVVSAAGSSVWELCCLGVPAALVCVSDNQQHSYERLLGRRAAVGLGSATAGLHPDAAATLRGVLGDTRERQRLSRAAARLVDGLGAWRVVRSWEQLTVRREPPRSAEPVRLRPAGEEDTATLLRWRNDPVTRAGSRDTGEVGPEQHRAWMAATLADSERHLLMARGDAGDVGTLRWDRVGDGEWEVSLTVAPERRGRGLAAPLLRAGEDWLAEHEPAAHTMLAAVHGDNSPSQRLFDAAGYLPDRTPDQDGFLGLIKQRVPSG